MCPMRDLALMLIMALALQDSVESTTDYCTLCKDHTMCKFKGPATNCQPLVLSEEDKKEILRIHNSLRSKIARGEETKGSPGPQPPASNMRKMIWDDELATITDRWLGQCVFAHDTCRNVERFSVGQNAYFSAGKKLNWTSVVLSWYKEVEGFAGNGASKLVSTYGAKGVVGHYTQVVWADTYAVGCAAAKKKASGPPVILASCNYGPAGNFLNRPLYQQGPACSSCSGEPCTDALCPSTNPDKKTQKQENRGDVDVMENQFGGDFFGMENMWAPFEKMWAQNSMPMANGNFKVFRMQIPN